MARYSVEGQEGGVMRVTVISLVKWHCSPDLHKKKIVGIGPVAENEGIDVFEQAGVTAKEAEQIT